MALPTLPGMRTLIYSLTKQMTVFTLQNQPCFFTILDNPTIYCSNFSYDLNNFDALCGNCTKHYLRANSIKFHCFFKKWYLQNVLQKRRIIGNESTRSFAIIEEENIKDILHEIHLCDCYFNFGLKYSLHSLQESRLEKLLWWCSWCDERYNRDASYKKFYCVLQKKPFYSDLFRLGRKVFL